LSIQGGAPIVISWFLIPINYRYNPHSLTLVIGFICTNLANELGHDLGFQVDRFGKVPSFYGVLTIQKSWESIKFDQDG